MKYYEHVVYWKMVCHKDVIACNCRSTSCGQQTAPVVSVRMDALGEPISAYACCRGAEWQLQHGLFIPPTLVADTYKIYPMALIQATCLMQPLPYGSTASCVHDLCRPRLHYLPRLIHRSQKNLYRMHEAPKRSLSHAVAHS